ncbi:sigma-54 dependent transcriptional regulator [uncultured Thalassolituus sp.]|uniref:sigma-54-dependent transcriptional regulator n=1 Tax=uncultured Thalassolituus sp. TaxID=285273 RepID=UPI00262E0C85|nr:sigma-54 dependent transcriptional regulator [uncultured Thalassolituus sp.]
MTASPLILIVDDQPQNLDVLVSFLSDSGLRLAVATDGESALRIARDSLPDLILLDIMMPRLSGHEVCERLKDSATTRDIPVIFMSALSDTRDKLRSFNSGAVDYLIKPLQREEVLARINTHLTIAKQRQELLEKNAELRQLNDALSEQINQREKAENALQLADQTLTALTRKEAQQWGIDAFIGQSQAIMTLLEEVRSLQQAGHTNVLVLGESGTGKELVSRAIHYGSQRSSKPFIAVNCSAIPADLADAEFFGHTKGAYTGAVSDRRGFFEQADGGTLFLDEIGDMPLSLQAKLLRVLEDGVVTPVGGRQPRQVNVRVVAATNVAMQERIQAKEFRQDLYFRLAGYTVFLPPLRERASDIPLLARHFLDLLSRQMGREQPVISDPALAALGRYHFPGNVRELKNMAEYALIASRGKTITEAHLHFLEPVTPPESTVVLSAADARSQTIVPAQTQASSDEEALVEYAREQGRIDNAQAQALLNVDHGRASYLLKKLHKEGVLAKQGERRWSYYTIL